MEMLKALTKKITAEQVTVVLMAVFVILNLRVPYGVASMVDTLPGMLTVLAGSLYLMNRNPLVGTMALIAGAVLIVRSKMTTGSYFVYTQPALSQAARDAEIKMMNNRKRPLEEEIIATQVPLASADYVTPTAVKPVLCPLKGAASV